MFKDMMMMKEVFGDRSDQRLQQRSRLVGRVNGKLQLEPLAVLDKHTINNQRGDSRFGATEERVEDHGALLVHWLVSKQMWSSTTSTISLPIV